jgi:hypothetical protein
MPPAAPRMATFRSGCPDAEE